MVILFWIFPYFWFCFYVVSVIFAIIYCQTAQQVKLVSRLVAASSLAKRKTAPHTVQDAGLSAELYQVSEEERQKVPGDLLGDFPVDGRGQCIEIIAML